MLHFCWLLVAICCPRSLFDAFLTLMYVFVFCCISSKQSEIECYPFFPPLGYLFIHSSKCVPIYFCYLYLLYSVKVCLLGYAWIIYFFVCLVMSIWSILQGLFNCRFHYIINLLVCYISILFRMFLLVTHLYKVLCKTWFILAVGLNMFHFHLI